MTDVQSTIISVIAIVVYLVVSRYIKYRKED